MAYIFSLSLLRGTYAYYHYALIIAWIEQTEPTENALCFGELKHELHCVTIITNFRDGYSWCTLIPVWHTILFFFFLYTASSLSLSLHQNAFCFEPRAVARLCTHARALIRQIKNNKTTRELRLSHPHNIGTIYLKVCNATHHNTRNEICTRTANHKGRRILLL